MDWFDYNTLSNSLNSLEEVVFAILGVILFIIFLFWFIDSLSKAVIIKKAGRSMGLGFVPIYNDYILCDVTGTNKIWFALKYCVPFFIGMIEAALPVENDALGILSIFSTFGYAIALSASLAKSFGRGMLTTVCHILFPQITRFVVAANSKYIGALGCNDVVFGNKKDVSYNGNMGQGNTNSTVQYNFCPHCGNAITEFDRFCNKCGKEI